MTERFLAAFDVHGDMQDKAANAVLFEFLRDFRPHHRICGGDVFDFRAMRRKATEAEKEMSMRADFEDGMEWLGKFRPQTWLRGNHDERLWDLARMGHGLIRDYATECCEHIESKMRRRGCRMLPYDRRSVYRLGKLKFLHGMFSGIQATRQTALTYADAGEIVVCGHGHAVDDVTVAGLARRRAMMAGCLCRLDMEYNRQMANSLRWAHGFVYGIINTKTGEVRIEQAQKFNEQWIMPTEFRAYRAGAAGNGHSR